MKHTFAQPLLWIVVGLLLIAMGMLFIMKKDSVEKFVQNFVFKEGDDVHRLKSCEHVQCVKYETAFGSLIKDEKNYLFIHIPKNAGTYMRKIFPGLNGSHDHISALRIKNRLPKMFEAAYTFAIIRDPYERCVSMYNNHVNTDKMDIKGWGTYGMNILKKHNVRSFEDFVKLLFAHKDDIQKLGEIVWEKQIKFITDENGSVIVDKLIDIRDLDHEIEVLKQRFDVTIQTPLNKINVSDTKDYMKYYSNQSVYDMVTKIYEEDVELYYTYKVK